MNEVKSFRKLERMTAKYNLETSIYMPHPEEAGLTGVVEEIEE